MAAIMKVLLLPQRDSESIWVNKELRYGTKSFFFFKQLFANASITIPRLVKLLLILFAYCKRTPVAPVFDCLYEPAKSTILNLAWIAFPFPTSL